MIGETISHYRILRFLGEGGMGVVYEAEDVRLGRHVALKFVVHKKLDRQETVERFEREARATSVLNHPNICTVHDVGEEGGRHFIAMEFLEGESLEALLARGPLPVRRLLELAAQIAEGLVAAHARGVIHRDIKPANVFVTSTGLVKIMDFGLAKILQSPAAESLTASESELTQTSDLTTPGLAMGTVSFMSPEQIRGEEVDARSDLFSFGSLIYDMAVGQPPFRGETPAVKLAGILERKPVPVAQLGYRPNHLAASLRRQETRTIGIVIPDLTNPFFAALVHRIEELAAESDYQILLMSSNEDTGQEAHRVDVLLARQTDGLIIAPARDDLSAFAASAADLPPTVLVDRGFGLPGFDTICADNFDAAKRGCQHLLSLGHRDIVLVVSDTGLANISDRVSGYRAALEEAGFGDRARVIVGGFTVDGCRGAIEQELRRADRPTAIFSAAYIATLGAIKAIRALDLEFPDDVSLLSFDDSDWMTALRPYVSAVAQPVEEMAAEAWRLLKQRLTGTGGDVARLRLPCSLQVRESTRPPSAARSKQRIGTT